MCALILACFVCGEFLPLLLLLLFLWSLLLLLLLLVCFFLRIVCFPFSKCLQPFCIRVYVANGVCMCACVSASSLYNLHGNGWISPILSQINTVRQRNIHSLLECEKICTPNECDWKRLVDVKLQIIFLFCYNISPFLHFPLQTVYTHVLCTQDTWYWRLYDSKATTISTSKLSNRSDVMTIWHAAMACNFFSISIGRSCLFHFIFFYVFSSLFDGPYHRNLANKQINDRERNTSTKVLHNPPHRLKWLQKCNSSFGVTFDCSLHLTFIFSSRSTLICASN